MFDAKAVLRRAQLTGILERVCQQLELTETQFDEARQRYEAIGKWLSDANDPLLRSTSIYAQGSIALGTTVRPHGRDEFDLDLVCFALGVSPSCMPQALKAAVGARLREHAYYRQILEEKPRCWRLNYKGQFHMDITPSITNPRCRMNGELVPDKILDEWKATNPRGYRRRFDKVAALTPQLRLAKSVDFAAARAEIEALPEPVAFKGVLRRIVQIVKRHRDLWFAERDPSLAPISVILTTLAAKAYAHCVATQVFDTEIDILIETIRLMPTFIERMAGPDGERYFVWNETTEGENFAEKWNADARLPRAFFGWHRAALADALLFAEAVGIDHLGKVLSASFGDVPVHKAIVTFTESVSAHRRAGRLGVSPVTGLAIAAPGIVPVKTNTFFGRRPK